MRTRTALSIVVPCFNEQEVLRALHERLSAVCLRSRLDCEIVLVNDGSTDATWQTMTVLAARDPHLVCVNLSRNFGHQLAIVAGLRESSGDAVLVIDADLQDPPELLPEMLNAMDRDAADVVYGRRTERDGEPRFKKIASHIYYRVLRRLAEVPIPPDAGDFRLLSRRVVDGLLAMPEQQPYIRGMTSWLGYKQVAIEYRRQPRVAGKSKYHFGRLVRLAMDGVTGFSVKPLTLSLRVGGVCLVAAFACLAAALYSWTGSELPTSGLLAALMLFLAGGQFLAIGVVGEYLGRMFAEVRSRPPFVVQEVVRHPRVAIRDADFPARAIHSSV